MNGAARKTEIGTVQLLAVTIVAFEPSQLTISVLYDPSLWRIYNLYAVIADPPLLFGAVQAI